MSNCIMAAAQAAQTARRCRADIGNRVIKFRDEGLKYCVVRLAELAEGPDRKHT